MKARVFMLAMAIAVTASGTWYFMRGQSGSTIVETTNSNIKEGPALVQNGKNEPAKEHIAQSPAAILWGMKLVNENVSDEDLDRLENLGIRVLEGEWGMDEATPEQVLELLDRLAARDITLIVNLSDEAAWGYHTTGKISPGQKPIWQPLRMEEYVQSIKQHRAIYGYDISYEAGENLPNGDWFRIDESSLRDAADSVRRVDSKRPIIIRMHYWDRLDGDFFSDNPFGPGIADVVILNLYSNYSQDKKTPLLPNMVRDSGAALVRKIRAVDPKVNVWISLAAFKELPLFIRPIAEDLTRDIRETLKIEGVSGVSFFGWGPERYPDTPPGWYLPRDGPDLLKVVASFTNGAEK